jgi:hypothetical protein
MCGGCMAALNTGNAATCCMQFRSSALYDHRCELGWQKDCCSCPFSPALTAFMLGDVCAEPSTCICTYGVVSLVLSVFCWRVWRSLHQ